MNNDKFCKAGEFENFRYRWVGVLKLFAKHNIEK